MPVRQVVADEQQQDAPRQLHPCFRDKSTGGDNEDISRHEDDDDDYDDESDEDDDSNDGKGCLFNANNEVALNGIYAQNTPSHNQQF